MNGQIPCKERIVHRVRGNIDVLSHKIDGNDDEVMNVLHVVAYAALREALRSAVSNHDITRCTTSNLISDVAGKAKLAVIPTDFDLRSLSALRVQNSIGPWNIWQSTELNCQGL